MKPQNIPAEPTAQLPIPIKGLLAETLAEILGCKSPFCGCPKEQGDG
jgi:hypothetical protein